MGEKFNFEALKEKFDAVDDTQDIRKEIDKITKGLTDKPFNPDRLALSKLHDIIDELRIPKTELGKLKKRALRQKLRTKTYLKEINLTYENKYDELLLDAPKKDKDNKSILKANIEAMIRKDLEDKGYAKYKYEAEKLELKIDSYLKEIDTLIAVLMDMSTDNRDKIKLMDLQRELGTLIDIKKGK